MTESRQRSPAAVALGFVSYEQLFGSSFVVVGHFDNLDDECEHILYERTIVRNAPPST